MTEKFWDSDTYAIVKTMKASGNRPGLIAQWKSAVEKWALSAVNDLDAASVRAWLPMWQVRPFYTAAELAPIWPALAIAIGVKDRMTAVKSAHRLANELTFAELPSLMMVHPVTRELEKFYIVERIHYWKTYFCTLNQSDFEKEFFNAT